MKLFVWDNVLEDYTSGMVCILARNEKQAWKMLYEHDPLAWWVLQGEPDYEEESATKSADAWNNLPEQGYFNTAIRPKIVLEPSVFVVWGGG